MRSRIRRDPAIEDAQTVERVRGVLQGHLAEGGPGASVSIRYVLDLLDPRGMWQFDPEHAAQRDAVPPSGHDPDADPLTGCKPVTPAPPS